MAAAKSRDTGGTPNFVLRANDRPLGPSVSGRIPESPQTHPAKPHASQITSVVAVCKRPVRAFSDDSSDSSSINDGNQAWPRNAMQLLRARMREAAEAAAAPVRSITNSMWERTKKEPTNDATVNLSAIGDKRKSKRHRSLEAKTARYYAKRQQTGWTERKGSASSSDDDGGFKIRREMSPRRKRGSREGSRSVSRDVSVAPAASTPPVTAPSSRVHQQERPDLPPSTTGVSRPSPVVPPQPPTANQFKAVNVPAIQITTEYDASMDVTSIGRLRTSVADRETLTIDEWIRSRPLSKSGSLAASTQSLASLSHRLEPKNSDLSNINKPRPNTGRPLTHAQSHTEIHSLYNSDRIQSPFSSIPAVAPVRSPSHMNLYGVRSDPAPFNKAPQTSNTVIPSTLIGHIQVNGLSSSSSQWNQPMSRYSLPAGMDEHKLGFSIRPPPQSPESVRNKRNFFEQLRKKSTDVSHAETSAKQELQPTGVPSKREAGRIALALTSAKSTELLPIGGHFEADSQFLHHALQTSRNAAQLLTDVRMTPSQSGKSVMEADIRGAVRWNSDWQLHQNSTSSGIYRPTMNLNDPSRLSVPVRTRLTPLKETEQKELEQALEELDEFYESISTKSEEVAPKSSTGLRSDSGVSSPRQVPSVSLPAEVTKKASEDSNRREYTKQWIHQGTVSQSHRDLSHQRAPNDIQHRGQSAGDQNGNRRTANSLENVVADDLGNRKQNNASPKISVSDIPNSGPLLMNVAYTPTVFTDHPSVFPKYPSINRPQPNLEMDNLLAGKTIPYQNTPSFRATRDLPKQPPSTGNDHVVTNTGSPKTSSELETFRNRDEAAFHQLKSEQRQPKDRPQTLSIVPEKKPEVKTRSISNSIKNLAKQFEGNKEEPKVPVGGVGKLSSPGKFLLQAAVQIGGKKVMSVRSPYNSAKPTPQSSIPTTANFKSGTDARISPKVSPMDEKEMDDLLRSLTALSSTPQSKKLDNFEKRLFPANQKKSNGSVVAKMFGLPSRTNVAMAV